MVEMTREERLSGVMPALLTPLNGDESLNKAVLRDLVAYEKSQGAKGFYISGATGEGLLLSMETRKELYKAAVQEIGKELTKIIHVSDINFATTKYLQDTPKRSARIIFPLFRRFILTIMKMIYIITIKRSRPRYIFR